MRNFTSPVQCERSLKITNLAFHYVLLIILLLRRPLTSGVDYQDANQIEVEPTLTASF